MYVDDMLVPLPLSRRRAAGVRLQMAAVGVENVTT